ncbi:MAG: PQQ-binding-like beta-propeller repeat protein [Verrucomicrobiota bacterium]|nr:PQQ-binding-like beta-propeller repeat protein [Verrucomicrobiota bacterium]
MKLSLLTPCIYLVSVLFAPAADWLQFRGNDNTGVATGSKLPTALDKDKHIAWQSPLPGRGLSSPLIIGDRVFITAASTTDQSRLHVICLNSSSGSVHWSRQFWATGRTICHEKTCNAAPTPASDGKNIYALFSSNDLICLDLEGNLKWFRGLMQDYPNASNSLGLASSPVIAGGALVVQIENDSDSFAMGIDLQSGGNLWKIPRTKRANWTSPVILKDGVVALQGSAGISGIKAATGKVLWTFGDGASTIPSSVPSKDGSTLYIPSNGITVIKPRPDNNTPEVLWSQAQLRPGTASPLVHADKLFVINRAGVLNAANRKNGERLWRIRLEGPFSGSPVTTGDFLYIASERKGLLQCVDLRGDEGKVVGTIELGETILGTPALSSDALYIRSDSHLWKISGSK